MALVVLFLQLGRRAREVTFSYYGEAGVDRVPGWAGGKRKGLGEQTKTERFLSLVRRVHAGSTPRSENDLTARLVGVFEELGLHAVLDTSVSSDSRKRPDVLAYASEEDSDLVSPAKVVVEAKKPSTSSGFSDPAEAIVSERYWYDKTYPYTVRTDNAPKVRFSATVGEEPEIDLALV